MGFESLEWYYRPVANGIWARSTDSAFSAYTPCAVDSLVISISYLVLLGLCCYRIWLIKTTSKVQRYRLRSKCYNYMLGLLSFYCTAEPVLRLVMGFSVFNLDGQTSLLPYEMVSLTIKSLSWCSILVMIGLEMHVYILELRWYVRFGLIYVLVGEAVMLDLILLMRDYYQHHRDIYFGWMTPLMLQGYNRPVTGKDVWKLDSWDQTVTLFERLQKCWAKESQRSKPRLLRALNSSLGGRFWLGGFFKIGTDLSRFAGPKLLNHLLQSMQRGDPAWIGYMYAFSILVGVV